MSAGLADPLDGAAEAFDPLEGAAVFEDPFDKAEADLCGGCDVF